MRPRSAATWTVLAVLALTPAARANIGPRWWGDVIGDPWGIKEVVIEHEQLTIDLRPLTTAGPIRVEVEYRLRNSGSTKRLALLFVSGQEGVSDFEAHLDDKLIASRPLPPDKSRWGQFPESWRPPSRNPGFERFMPVCWFHAPYKSVPVALDLDLPPGSSTLRVRYQARACGTDEAKPVVTWQLPYVLSPAREWGGFGILDVTVHVPEGWEAKGTPELERNGSTLRGHFDGLPADALVVATRAPVPAAYRWAWLLMGTGYLLTSLLGALACWRVGRWLGGFVARDLLGGYGRRAEAVWWLAPILAGVCWAGLVYLAGAEAPHPVFRWALGAQESPYFHEMTYGWHCLSALIAVVVFVAGGVITQVSARLAMRRAQRGAVIDIRSPARDHD